MLGAMIGDYVGSPYEFDSNNIKTEEFPLFGPRCYFTDDSVMTIAVADALMNALENGTDISQECIKSMQHFGRMFPHAGYGCRFQSWLVEDDPKPYNSCGNGSAMRVSPVGWLFDNLERTEQVAEMTAVVSHNHVEGIKGAQSIAVAIFLARSGASKQEIKETIESRYAYDLDRTLEQIRPDYHMVEICQESVPEAIIAFLESTGYESALRKAVSIGGDSDTIACIAGGIAEAFYGIPEELKSVPLGDLHPSLSEVLSRWHEGLDSFRQLASKWEGPC